MIIRSTRYKTYCRELALMDLYTLLYEAKNNSPAAQKYLYEQFSEKMYLLCRRYIKQDQTAEEVMMNGFLRIFRSLKNFAFVSEETSLAWMKRIMINECLRRLSIKSSYLQIVETELPDIRVEESISAELTARELYKYIDLLPDGYRTVFNLYVVEELSHEEIAYLLHISIRTSRSQLTKARVMLKNIIIKNHKEYANWLQK